MSFIFLAALRRGQTLSLRFQNELGVPLWCLALAWWHYSLSKTRRRLGTPRGLVRPTLRGCAPHEIFLQSFQIIRDAYGVLGMGGHSVEPRKRPNTWDTSVGKQELGSS